MKLVVVGRGLASMGLLWNVAKKQNNNDLEVVWIGTQGITSNDLDPHYCSHFSTALIALQGIKKGVSELGDLLFDSYFTTLEFIKEYNPPGVEKLDRFHLDHGGDCISKFKKRFGSVDEQLSYQALELGPGVWEEAYSFNPKIFLSWFEKDIVARLSKLEIIEDSLTHYDEEKLYLIGKEITYDQVFFCTGAMGADLKSLTKDLNKNLKKAVGHYIAWEDVVFENQRLNQQSFVLTYKGHNLIYRHLDKSIVWGGSTYNDDITAPRIKDLELDLEELLTTFRDFKFQGQKSIQTGVRAKASKREPIFQLHSPENCHFINGFYKNGWTLCHELGQRAVYQLKLI